MEGNPECPDGSPRALWERFTESRALPLRGQLIERYLPLARVAAARFYRLRADDSVPFEDYLQYARIGLVEAIDDYDPRREASFETYSSYRIRGAMLNGLGRESETAAQRNFWRTRSVDRAEHAMAEPPASSAGDEPDPFVPHAADDEPEVPAGPLALGFLLEREEDVADEAAHANPHAAAEQVELLVLVGAVLQKLPPRERELIRRHYFEQCEFRVIAHELALSPGRVSQLHSQALVRIRELLGAPTGTQNNV